MLSKFSTTSSLRRKKKTKKTLYLNDVYSSHIDSTAVLQDKQCVFKLCPIFEY